MRQSYVGETINVWEQSLLHSQYGAGYFSGIPYQRGTGIGSVFRGLWRAIWPAVKKVGATAGRAALSSGADAAKDLLSGENMKTTLKKRGKQALGRTLEETGKSLQSGSGFGFKTRRTRRKAIKGIKRKRKLPPKKRRAKRQKRDIFA